MHIQIYANFNSDIIWPSLSGRKSMISIDLTTQHDNPWQPPETNVDTKL